MGRRVAWLARLLRRLLQAFGRPGTADALGRRGERAAERALVAAGYEILARRARYGGVEVDLVARDGEALVLVEVKTTRGAAAPPAERVDASKRRRLGTALRALLRDPALAARPVRLDVVEVRLGDGPPRCAIRKDHARFGRGGSGRSFGGRRPPRHNPRPVPPEER